MNETTEKIRKIVRLGAFLYILVYTKKQCTVGWCGVGAVLIVVGLWGLARENQCLKVYDK